MKRFNYAAAVAAVLAAALALPARGDITPVSFTLDTTAQGGPLVGAKYIDFSYEGEVDLVGNAFNTTGVAFFGSFRHSLAEPPIGGTGLGDKYNLYATYIAQGLLAKDSGGTVHGSLDNFTMQLWLDPNRDTRGSTFTGGLAGGNEFKFATGDTDDDILLATAELINGATIRSPSLAKGGFEINFHVKSHNPLLGGGAFAVAYPIGTITGVTSFADGFVDPPGVAFDQRLSGSGNIALVPESSTYALVAAGLAMLVVMRVRQRESS